VHFHRNNRCAYTLVCIAIPRLLSGIEAGLPRLGNVRLFEIGEKDHWTVDGQMQGTI
jgi:hypothetical protein